MEEIRKPKKDIKRYAIVKFPKDPMNLDRGYHEPVMMAIYYDNGNLYASKISRITWDEIVMLPGSCLWEHCLENTNNELVLYDSTSLWDVSEVYEILNRRH